MNTQLKINDHAALWLLGSKEEKTRITTSSLHISASQSSCSLGAFLWIL